MNFKLDFIGRRKLFFLISAIVLALGLISLFTQGLNLGIDFVSGSRLDIHIGKKYDLDQAKEELEKLGYSSPNTRVAGNEGELLIFRTHETMNKEQVAKVRDHFQKIYGKQVSVQEQTVSPIIGRELARNAMIAVLVASLGIILYVSIRFEYRFALAAVIALFHDVLIVIGIFSIFQWEVDVIFIAAILTIVGYSVNDTIVIFDRIRENLKLQKPKQWEDLAQMVNESIQQTIVRSLNTVVTVLFGAFALILFGGESIRYFSIALLVGLIAGTYSSIFMASGLWIGWKWRSMKRARLKESS